MSSPYFFTNSNHPGQNFVVENLLSDGNYDDLENEMSNALFAKNKIGFVDGTLLMPQEDLNKFTNWKICNAVVRGWLVSSMEKEIKSTPQAYELGRMITTI